MIAKENKFFLFMMLFLILLLGYLSYQVVAPFLIALLWATVFSIVFYPVYVLVLRYVKRDWVASLFTLVLILFVLIGPLSYLAYVLAGEIKELVERAQYGPFTIQDFLGHPKVAWLLERLKSIPAVGDIDVEKMILHGLAALRAGIMNLVSGGAKNVLHVIFNFVLMSFSVFFLLKDGPGFIKRIRNYLPFSEKQKDKLERQIKGMVVSTIYGGVLIALVQGTLGGIAFFALGVASPVFWGSVMSIMSFVPAIGTAGVWAPAAFYLFMTGDVVKGIIMVAAGGLVISSIDNVLKPVIISGRTKMHTLLIFFSVLGGINFFGIIGFILGPLTLALFLSVLEIFVHAEAGAGGGGADAEHG